MKALIDADIFQYEFGNSTNDEGKLLPWPFVQSRIQARINGIVQATGSDSYQLYLTSDDKSNFRYDIATILPYKGNRKSEKPFYYQHIRNFLIDHRGAIEVFGMEADDAISIHQWNNYFEAIDFCKSKGGLKHYIENEHLPEITGVDDYDKMISLFGANVVTCSRDKDLNMVPGWHYSWGCGKQKEKTLWWQDELSGLKSFYKQILTGDSVDNIPGLHGVGKSSSHLRSIDTCISELEMYLYCLTEYRKRFGSYAEQFLFENARLLWMVQHKGQIWQPPKDSSKENDN